MDRIGKLRSFLEENPKDSFVKHALALEYVKAGDDDKARELFESILQDDENYTGSYYHLCSLLVRTGKTDEAMKWFRKGLEKTKAAGDRHAYNELFSAYEELTEE